MHHVVLERWSRRDSLIHRRDPRVKLIATLAFLISVATTLPVTAPPVAAYALFLLCCILIARVPLSGLLLRSLIVLPFAGAFALISVLAGDPARAVAVLVKSYLSTAAVLLLVSATPMPRLLHGAEQLGAPRMVVLVVQFLYRYLFVISEQGQHMRQASRCRGGFARSRRSGHRSSYRAAAGALAVLFGRSYQRAEAIHRAMLARGFQGRFRLLSPPALRAADLLFLIIAAGVPVAVRLAAGGFLQ